MVENARTGWSNPIFRTMAMTSAVDRNVCAHTAMSLRWEYGSLRAGRTRSPLPVVAIRRPFPPKGQRKAMQSSSCGEVQTPIFRRRRIAPAALSPTMSDCCEVMELRKLRLLGPASRRPAAAFSAAAKSTSHETRCNAPRWEVILDDGNAACSHQDSMAAAL